MTNRRMKKKLRQAFARLTPAQAGSEQTQTLHTNPQSPEPEMPMKLPKSRLAFPTIAAVAAILAVVIFVGGPLLLGPSVSSGNNQPGVSLPSNSQPNITPPNSSEPYSFSDELKLEIEQAWEKTYGCGLGWSDLDYRTRYYGTYGDGCVAIFQVGEIADQVIETRDIMGYKFIYSTPFQLLLYWDGIFVTPEYACIKGMITKDDIAAIASWHMIHPGTPDWAKEQMYATNLISQETALEYARNYELANPVAYFTFPDDYLETPVNLTAERYTLVYKFVICGKACDMEYTLNALTGEILYANWEACSCNTSPTTPPDGKLGRDTAVEKALAYAGLTRDQALITVEEDTDEVPYHYDITLTTDKKEYFLEIGMYDGGGLYEFEVEYFDPNDYNPDATEGPNLPPPNKPSDLPSDELIQEIEKAWGKTYGSSLGYARYYGIYGDGFVAIFRVDEVVSEVEHSITIADYVFSYNIPFELLIYRGGEFIPLEYAYNQGMISKADVAAIAAQHMTYSTTSLFDEEKALSCALKYASWKKDTTLTKDDLTHYQVVFDKENWRYDIVVALEDHKYCFEIDGNTGYALKAEMYYGGDMSDENGSWVYTKPEAVDIALKDRGYSESDVTHLACYETEDIYYVVSFIYNGWEYEYKISGITGRILSLEANSEYFLYG